MSQPVVIEPAEPVDVMAIEALHAHAFGPGRFTRTAYRVREGQDDAKRDLSPFCRVAMLDGRLIGALKLVEVAIGGTSGALMLGPVVVDPEFAGQGVGRRLINSALQAARAAGAKLVILVGDEPYYGRFGFKRVPPGQITLPGPVNPERLLAAEIEPDALPGFRGRVSAA